jgi:putative transposase
MSKSGKKKSRADRARDIALYRYSLIRPLADVSLSAAERGRLVRELAAQVHLGPSGQPVTVSARTAAHIARIIQAERGWAPSPRTLQRHFARLELNTGPDGMAPKAFGRFEADEPDQLWVSDGLHGPIVAGRRAVLFALLDDYSRYVVGHRWGHGEETLGMQAALHDAVKTHGCPRKLYCDNGSAYSSRQLAWSAAVLDIRLVHSRITSRPGQNREVEPHRARAVPGRDRHRRRGRHRVVGRAEPVVHRLVSSAVSPGRAYRDRRYPRPALPRRGPGPGAAAGIANSSPY